MKQIEKVIKENNSISQYIGQRLGIPQKTAYQRLGRWKKGSLSDPYKQEILVVLNERLGSSYTIHELDTEVGNEKSSLSMTQ